MVDARSNPRSPSPPGDQQPGLEVAPTEHLPEVDASATSNQYYSTLPQTIHHPQVPVDPEVYKYQQPPWVAPEVDQYYAADPRALQAADPPKKSRKKQIILLVVVVIVLVVVAGVVGGVIGSRAASSSGSSADDTPTPTEDEPPSTTKTGNSSAAMTGTATEVPQVFAPAAVSWGHPHLDVFALTNNADTGGWVHWKSRRSNATSEDDWVQPRTDMQALAHNFTNIGEPALAVSRREIYYKPGGPWNWTEVQVVGNGDGLAQGYDDDTWQWRRRPQLADGSLQWESMGKPFSSAPFSVKYNKNVDWVKTFYVGRDEKLATVCYAQFKPNFKWLYECLDGPAVKGWAPAAVAWSGNDERLDVFAVRAANNHLVHWSYEAERDDWADVEDLQGFVTIAPVAVSRTKGTIDVLARGGDGGVWHLGFDTEEGWTEWAQISGDTHIIGQPHAISVQPGRIDLFVWAEDSNALLHKTYDAKDEAWSEFETLIEGGLVGPPTATGDDTGDVHVFVYNDQRELVWLTLGPDGKVKRKPEPLGTLPANTT